MVVLTDEDLSELPISSSKEIAVEKFVPAEQIDPMLLDRSYYLEPEKSAAKPYALLRDALKESDRMAVVTVSIRTRMTIAVLRVRDDVIVMQTMLWPDEIRSPEFANLGETEAAAKPAELKMANMLVESLAGDYDPDDYEDDYQQAVEALVKAKLEGGEVREAPAAKETAGEVVDLLSALQRSVERAKASRGEPVEEAGEPPAEQAASSTAEKAAPKKAAPRKTAAKKTATKAPARQTAAKKAPSREAAKPRKKAAS
jgi:DNA end-binding protein Ku